jgi:hypothetical protein
MAEAAVVSHGRAERETQGGGDQVTVEQLEVPLRSSIVTLIWAGKFGMSGLELLVTSNIEGTESISLQ